MSLLPMRSSDLLHFKQECGDALALPHFVVRRDFMRKTIAAGLALLGIMSVCGCAADRSEGITEQLLENTAQVTVETQPVTTPQETSPTEEIKEIPETEASLQATEPAEQIDPVLLAGSFNSDYLGLPDPETIYIFRDKRETAEINGALYYGVSCYDDSEGQLVFICDFYFSADGLTAYRAYPDNDFRLLPEKPDFSGFDPEIQSPEDIFSQANELYAAAFGDLSYDPQNSPAEIDGASYYPVTDERLNTSRKLNSALEKYFTGELLNKLSAGNGSVISDENGALWCTAHSGGNAGYLGTEYSLDLLTEDKAVFSAVSRFEYEAGVVSGKKFGCTAVRTDSGWRFTRFEFPY